MNILFFFFCNLITSETDYKCLHSFIKTIFYIAVFALMYYRLFLNFILNINFIFGTLGWLSHKSVQLWMLAQVMISRVCDFEPLIGLCADGAESACDSLSVLLSVPLPCSCSLFLSRTPSK